MAGLDLREKEQFSYVFKYLDASNTTLISKVVRIRLDKVSGEHVIVCKMVPREYNE